MTRIQTTIFDNFQERVVPAFLSTNLNPSQIKETGDQWFEQRTTQKFSGVWLEHYHWNWGRKAEFCSSQLAYQWFALECRDQIEGLMLLESCQHQAILPPDRGKNLVYIEFIESAPHNVKGIVEKRRYKGIGSRLLEAAVQYSIEQEFEGRVALHSLPQAECFYESKGMQKKFFDEEKKLYYFEWSKAAACEYINRF